MQAQMNSTRFQISQYKPSYQQAVETLILPIQQIEFGVPITREEQPDLMDIAGTFQKGTGNFWLALRDNQVIGTIGIVDIGNNQVALKKMFVHKDYRGKDHGVAAALMSRVKEWCKQNGVRQIYLGTTAQMTRAQKFYENNGYVLVEKSSLPPAFPIVSVDSVFYSCDLS